MRSMRAAIAAVVLSGSVAACGSDTTAGRPTSTGTDLQAALSHVQPSADTIRLIEFSRPAAAGKTFTDPGKPLSNTFFGVRYLGSDRLRGEERSLNESLGLDLAKARYLYSAGEVPRVAGAFVGLGTDKARSVLTRLGGDDTTRDGTTTIRLRPDDEIGDDDDPIDRRLGALTGSGDLNVVRLRDDAFRFGSSAAKARLVDADPPGALGVDRVAAVARCLGNPIAARLTTPMPSDRRRPGVTYLGLGATAQGRDAGVEERMCVATSGRDAAQAIADAIERDIRSGTDSRGNRWSKVFATVRASVQGTTVQARMTLVKSTDQRFANPAGRLITISLIERLPGLYR